MTGKLLFSTILFILPAGMLNADSVTSQVTCAVGINSVTATDSCSLTGNPGTLATASASISFTLANSVLSVVASEQGSAKSDIDLVHPGGQTAAYSASNSLTLTLDTPGSTRPGFFLITGSESGGVGSDSDFCESIFGYSNGCNRNARPSIPQQLVPITLGDPFTFAYTQSISCFANNSQVVCPGTDTASAHYDFHLYEADGTTPVLITLAAPEPSSGMLLLPSLAGITLVVRRRRRSLGL